MGLLVHRQQRGLCLLLIYQEVKVFIKIILMYAQILALVNSLYAICSVEAGIPDARWGVGMRLSTNTSSRYIMWAIDGYGVTASLVTSSTTSPFQGVIPGDTTQAQYTWLASNVNSIYGNSSTVTPDSCSVKFFIRYI